MRQFIVLSSVVVASLVPIVAHGQANAPDGAAVFTRACAGCHKPGQAEVPAPEVLRTLTPESIINSLTNGKMSVQGSSLTAGSSTMEPGPLPASWITRRRAWNECNVARWPTLNTAVSGRRSRSSR